MATKRVRCGPILFYHGLTVLRIHDYSLRSPEVMRTVHTSRRGFAAARLLGFRVRIPSKAWIFVCCECCALSGRGLCIGLIIRPEESYRVCVCVCDREASIMTRPWPTGDCRAMGGKKTYIAFSTSFQILQKLT